VALGFRDVFVAFNVAQAKDLTLAEDIELVLCDIEMPEESGLDYLSWLKTARPRVEVIFLTAHADFSLAQQAVRLQGFDYLLKPIAAQDLKAVVSRALGKIRQPESGPGDPGLGGEAAAAPAPEGGAEDLRMPEMAPWAILLKSGAKERVRYEFRGAVDRIRNKLRNQVPPAVWNRLLLDYQQMISSVLKFRSIPARDLLGRPEAPQLLERAPLSAIDLTRWVDYSLDFVQDRLEQLDRDNSPVGNALRFIGQHLGDNLSCEQVAAFVGMNPDYLTRLFKKETGQSVSNHILHEKMKFAAELLTETNLPISEIGARVGYENHAHFSTAFKKGIGQSPSEYRTLRKPKGIVR
jgi:AraC-like DNA-binding protein/CheY-like chemotaxis protein